MKVNEAEKFREFLKESFGAGVKIRELRLSDEETEYIKRIYPRASLNKSIPTEAPDGKRWYKVSLRPPKNDKELQVKDHLSAIQQENLQLKQELERLKREKGRAE
ncbi:hypothetical protein RRV45_02250 [Bacillus sp. DTU_2020_1000418_1_SI_GHA_SEK_038]|uniref:hypothetical protein n=1 Tax=Bacillus sp. DTU_2020_1000418_1_SI_GHA_SEK_038 TaxID=3077585 RepID=UPI0028F08D0A|nr:hypothetical protein [Bacillus sp. DTU_2020_1000418_1_SI_GHA_SEK_038]WNS75877.1 hypothetical protein RRV45_02250 [Bacillus sp. DTU_2020_1000418_1_SI_GHA_SEK_038]